jgi:hypothetical protein
MTSCILCIIADRTLPLHNLRRSDTFRATSLESDSSQNISAALFGHSLVEVGITAADPVKLYHTIHSMCLDKPTDFTVSLPRSSLDNDPIKTISTLWIKQRRSSPNTSTCVSNK